MLTDLSNKPNASLAREIILAFIDEQCEENVNNQEAYFVWLSERMDVFENDKKLKMHILAVKEVMEKALQEMNES